VAVEAPFCTYGPREWAYLAGLIDGDGSIAICRASKPKDRPGVKYSLAVRIATNGTLLEELRKEIGFGSIHYRKRTTTNYPMAELAFSHAGGRFVLRHVLPYLRLKQAQAKVALATPYGPKGRFRDPAVQAAQERAYIEMRTLNSKNGRGRYAWQ
jgi:hypothetical protein